MGLWPEIWSFKATQSVAGNEKGIVGSIWTRGIGMGTGLGSCIPSAFDVFMRR